MKIQVFLGFPVALWSPVDPCGPPVGSAMQHGSGSRRGHAYGHDRLEHSTAWHSTAKQGAPQGAPQRVPRKPVFLYFFTHFEIFLRFWVKYDNEAFWCQHRAFLSFSRRNHAESCRNFFNKWILNPKHARLDQNSDSGNVLSVLCLQEGYFGTLALQLLAMC